MPILPAYEALVLDIIFGERFFQRKYYIEVRAPRHMVNVWENKVK
jgi:hypothetical protein